MKTNNYSILNQIPFTLPPVGVKFSYFQPQNIHPLEKDTQLSLCEILKTAQTENRPFYFSRQNHETCIGKVLLGMADFPPFAESGEIGQRLGIFDDPRCNKNLYQYIPKHPKDTVNYVLFSPVAQLTFEPDVLVISATPDQAEIIMRAMTYSTGEIYQSLCTPVMGCAWMLIHPYMTGQVNFIIPAIVHGMHDRRLYPSDTIIISIPYRWIPTILTNLQRMPHQLEGHKSKAAYFAQFEGILADLSEKSKNP